MRFWAYFLANCQITTMYLIIPPSPISSLFLQMIGGGRPLPLPPSFRKIHYECDSKFFILKGHAMTPIISF